MPKAYIIARVTVEDTVSYAEYAKGAFAAMQKYGARILARGGRAEALEGEIRPRNVILEFESYEQAKRYFQSPEYQAARKHRENVSSGDFIVVEAFEGEQP